MTMTTPAPEIRPDSLIEHICACRLPSPAERRAIRRAARVSLSQVAEVLGVDIMTVSRWERGLHEPRARYVPAYQRLLDALIQVASRERAEQTRK